MSPSATRSMVESKNAPRGLVERKARATSPSITSSAPVVIRRTEPSAKCPAPTAIAIAKATTRPSTVKKLADCPLRMASRQIGLVSQ